MAYSLDQLRDLYPGSLGGLSDVDAINKISSLSGQDPKELAAQYGVINPDQGDFSRGLTSGVDGAQAGLYGLLGYAGEVFGSDKIRDYGYKGYQDNMAEVELRSKPTDNIENAENAGDVLDSAQYWLGYALPQIVEAIVGSKGVGFVGKKTVERKVKKKVAERFGKDNVDRVMKTKSVQNALKQGEKIGSLVGIGSQAVGTEVGYTYGGAVDKAIEDGKAIDSVDLMRVTKYGLAAGAAEFAGDTLLLGLGKIGPAKNLLNKTGKIGNSSSRIKNAATRGTIGSTLEAGTELTQTGLEEMGSGLTFEEANFLDPTSAFAGAVGGGAMGLAGGISTKGPDATIKTIDDGSKAAVKNVQEQTAQTQNQEDESERQRQNQQKQIDDKNARVADLRDAHSTTFIDSGTWIQDAQVEQDMIERIQVLDPNTEIGAAFKQYQKDNDERLSNNEQANQKLIDKFFKDIAVPVDAEAQKIAYLQALDDHAELQEARANGTRNVDENKMLAKLTELLNDRNAALDVGDMALLRQVDMDVNEESDNDPLFAAEWNEFKRNAAEQEALTLAAQEIENKELKKKKPKQNVQKQEDNNPPIVETPPEKKFPPVKPSKEGAAIDKDPINKTFTFNDIEIKNVKMSPQQRDIYNYIKQSVELGTADELFTGEQTKGKGSNKAKGWATTKIAKALGLKGKGNVSNQIKRINEAIRKEYGLELNEIIAGMSAKEDAGNQAALTAATEAAAEFDGTPIANKGKQGYVVNAKIDSSETLDPTEAASKNEVLSIPGMSTISDPGGTGLGAQKLITTRNVPTKDPVEQKLASLSPEDRAKEKTKIDKANEDEAAAAKQQKEEKASPKLDKQGQARRDEAYNKRIKDVQVVFKKENKETLDPIQQEWDNNTKDNDPKFNDMSLRNRSEWVLATAVALETGNESGLQKARQEIALKHTSQDALSKAPTVKDIIGEQGTTANLKKEATKRLGKGWQVKHTKLNKLLRKKEYKKFVDMVELIEKQSDTKTGEQKNESKRRPKVTTKKVSKARSEGDTKKTKPRGQVNTPRKDSSATIRKPKKQRVINEPTSTSTVATPSSFESMFLNLLGEKSYNRIKNRISFHETEAAAQEAEGIADLRDVGGFVRKAFNPQDSSRKNTKLSSPDTMVFILENVPRNQELAIFMHEIGGHIGLDNILTPEESVAIANQIKAWAAKAEKTPVRDQTVEMKAARRAMKQVVSLNIMGQMDDVPGRITSRTSSNPDAEAPKLVKETIAYFITEAAKLGVAPSQNTDAGKILNKFRVAFRKFVGLLAGEADSVTAQDIADMAFGAALLELNPVAGAGTREAMANQRNEVFEKSMVTLIDNFGNKQTSDVEKTVNSIDYWEDRINAFIAKRLPKNDKGHYITPNYIPVLADWKKYQDERAILEKKLRKGLRETANERMEQAKEHERKMNDPDGNFLEDSDYVMSSEEKAESVKEIATTRDWIRDHWGETAAKIWTDITNIFKGGANSTKFLHQFINDVKELMPSAEKWHKTILELEMARNEIKQRVDDIAIRSREMTEESLTKVNQFLAKSTVEQVWGYNPYDKTDPRYKKVKVDLEMEKIFKTLDAQQQQLVIDVFAHGDAMLKRKREIAKMFGVSDSFFGVSGLEGPYAPLRRFGKFVAEFKSQQYLDAEALAKEVPNNINRQNLEKLRSNPKAYEVRFFGTLGKAEQYVDKNKKNFAYSEASEKTKIISEGNADYQVLSKVLAGLKASDFGKDTVEYKAIKEMIEGMYFDTLSEDNARRNQAKRKTIAGYDDNMMRSFLANATAEANLIANMEHGTEVNAALLESRKEKNLPGQKNKLSQVYNMMVSHYASNLNERPTPIQDKVAALNTVYMLTSSIGYHLTNATQPIMVTIPKLVGDFGAKNYSKTMKLYWQGLSMARDVVTFNVKNFKFQTAIDINQAPEKYQPLLRELQLRQLLDVGIEQDLAEFNRSDSGYDFINKGTEKAGNFAHRLYQIARLVEAYNRISTATAAFEMAKANPQVTNRLNISATEYAITIVQDTQGNFSAMDAPLILKKLPKITGQYRKYQIMMAWVYADATKKAFRGTSPEEKAAGKRTVGFALGHAAMFSGMTGVPVIGMVAPLFMGIGNEGADEPEDLERWLQRNVGDETLGTILSRGLPAVFGIDMSTKLSQQKIFNPLPYSEFSADQESMRNIFFEAVSGPFGATASNAMRSIEYAKEGNVWRATEYALPKGVRTAMESFRLGTEGYSLRNGDVVATPDDFNGWSLALNALGIPATDINKIKWTRGQQYELNDWFEKEQSKIRKRYVEAKQNRNNKEAKKQMLAWKDLQKSKDRVRPFFNNERGSLRKTPLSSLLKAVKQQQKRQDKYRKQLGTN